MLQCRYCKFHTLLLTKHCITSGDAPKKASNALREAPKYNFFRVPKNDKNAKVRVELQKQDMIDYQSDGDTYKMVIPARLEREDDSSRGVDWSERTIRKRGQFGQEDDSGERKIRVRERFGREVN